MQSPTIIDLTYILNSETTVYPNTPKPILQSAATILKNGYNELDIRFYSHTGTHIDAPFHILPDGKTLDQLPITQFFGTAAMIDCTTITSISKSHLIPYQAILQEVDFVILKTGWSKYWKEEKFFENFPTLTAAAAKYLVSLNLKGIGLDTISIDNLTNDNYTIHKIILGAEMVIIENLTNLDQLPTSIFQFSCLPLKIENADGSPIRAIAIF